MCIDTIFSTIVCILPCSLHWLSKFVHWLAGQLFTIRGTQDSRLEGFKVRGLGQDKTRLKTLDIPCTVLYIRSGGAVMSMVFPSFLHLYPGPRFKTLGTPLLSCYIKSGSGEVPMVTPAFLHLYPRPRFKTLGTPVLSCVLDQVILRCQWSPQPFYTWWPRIKTILEENQM